MLATAGFRRQATIAFIFVTAVLDIVAMGIIIPVFPTLVEEFAGSNASAGWINGLFVALWAGIAVRGLARHRIAVRPVWPPAGYPVVDFGAGG